MRMWRGHFLGEIIQAIMASAGQDKIDPDRDCNPLYWLPTFPAFGHVGCASRSGQMACPCRHNEKGGKASLRFPAVFPASNLTNCYIGRSVEAHEDRFGLGVCIDRLGAHFAAKARLLVATHRHGHIGFGIGIDPHAP
jgi:hypothetical protein